MSRYVVWTLLSLLVAAHVSVDMLLNPIGASVDMRTVEWPLIAGFAIIGAMLSQPALLAVVAVLWPAQWAMRLLASLGLLVLMLYAMLLGGVSISADDLSAVFGPGLLFVIFALVLWAMSRLRGWRMVVWTSGAARSAGRQFSVRALLVVIAIAGVLFALGRLIMPATVRLDAAIDWSKRLIDGVGFALIFAAPLLSLMLPALPLALAIGSRWRCLLATVLAAVAMPLGVLFVTVVLMGEKLDAVTVLSVCCPAVGAYGSIILSLFVLRWCGFRLLRGPKALGSVLSGQVDRPVA